MPEAITTQQPREVKLRDGRKVTVAPPDTTPKIVGPKKKDDKWWLLLLLITAADIAQAEKFWRLHSPRSFAGMLGHTNGFGFDEPSQRWTKNGRPQDDEETRAVYLAFLASATKDIERQAGRMARGRLPLDDWEQYQANVVKSLYIASDALGRGGIDAVKPSGPQAPAPISEKIPVDLPGALNDAVTRLKRFADEIESGSAGDVAKIVWRAGLYAGPGHGVYEHSRVDSHNDATDDSGVKIAWEYRNNLDDQAQHCRTTKYDIGCPEVTDEGWRPINELPDVGARSCKSACRCWWSFRVAEPNKLSNVREGDFKSLGTLGLSATRTVHLSGGRSVVLALRGSDVAEGEDWETINGAHVLIGGDGKIAKGPKHLVGKTVDEVNAHGKAAPESKSKEGYHRIERDAVGNYKGTHTASGIEHNPEHAERIKKLGVSPGYAKIHLAKDPQAMLQVHQTSASGLETRVYSDEHHAKQKKVKHARVDDFRKNHLKNVERSIANDPSEEAAVLRLIRPTGIRQGSDADTKAKQKAYGATTMRAEHVMQENGKTVLHFIGKDGVQNHIPIDDERTANELKERAKSGGKLYNTTPEKVRKHLDKLAPGFLVKDLRTIVANEQAEKEIRGMAAPKSLPDLVKARMEVATKVAKKLGNTPAIALGEYINPERFSKWETSAANNEQASAIENYAKTKGIDVNAAAKEWIGTHAKAFRENFNKRLESPKKVKAYDDGTQTTGRIGGKGQKAPAMALGGWGFSRTSGGNGFDGVRRTALHQGRDSFGGSSRGSVGRMNSTKTFKGNTMTRQVNLSDGRVLHIQASEPSGALALYNHNHDALGQFTDAETGSDHASSKAHAASAMAKKQNTKSSHRNAAAFHREAADRAEDADNYQKADKHTKMAEAHESAAKGISWK